MIIKRGEPQLIKICFDDDIIICENCQKPKIIICLDERGQEVICECELQEEEKQGE